MPEDRKTEKYNYIKIKNPSKKNILNNVKVMYLKKKRNSLKS